MNGEKKKGDEREGESERESEREIERETSYIFSSNQDRIILLGPFKNEFDEDVETDSVSIDSSNFSSGKWPFP